MIIKNIWVKQFIWQLAELENMIKPGAYKGKEHATTIYTWVPSKYEFKPGQFPYKESA